MAEQAIPMVETPDPHAWPDLGGVVLAIGGLLVLGVWFMSEVML